MSVTLALTVGGLTAVGVYLVTSRSLTRILLGFALLGHAAVIALIASGGESGEPPLAGQAPVEELSDPLPQAFALTAIVISFGLTLFLLALARRQQQLTGDDLVEDDLEDRRIAIDDDELGRDDADDEVADADDHDDQDHDDGEDDVEIAGQMEIDE
ncbi:MAG: NADH-quinone oxidoreductase subunit K [Actinomycetota bacterium]